MKQIIIKGFRVGIFLLILGVVIWRTGKILDWKDTTGNYLSSTQQLYHTPENTMDVIFLGSSHCYCGIYPAYLWRDRGISAFDMAVSGQDRASTYHTLVEALKTQKPKVVFVDMYGLTFDRHEIEGNVYRNMLSMKVSENSIELIKEYVEPEKQNDFFARWPIIHTRFWEVGKYDYIQYLPSEYGRGAAYQWGTHTADPGDAETEEADTLKETNRQWLTRLYELSREKDFKLVFFVAPFNIKEEEQRQVNAAAEYAKEKEIPFIDFNKIRYQIGLNDELDFVDEFHCNALGAEKVTEYIRDYLEQNFSLEDHRGDVKYAQWDMDYKWFQHLKLKAEFEGDNSAEEFTGKIARQEDLVIAVSFDPAADSEASEDEKNEILASLRTLGIVSEQGDFAESCPQAEGLWIRDNSGLRKVSENDPSAKPFCADIGRTDAIRLRYSSPREASDMMINYTQYLRTDTMLTIVVYDPFLEEVLCTKNL